MSSDETSVSLEVRVTRILQSNKYVNFSATLLNKGYASRRLIVFVSSDNHVPLELTKGQIWRVNGVITGKDKVTHGKFVQERLHIKAVSLECILPAERESFVKLIGLDKKFKSIGTDKAIALWNAFGPRIYAVIKDRDIELIRSKTDLTEKACLNLFSGMERYENLRYNNWLCKLGLPVDVTLRIIKYHKSKTIDMITENPFRLMDFGLSFTQASQIARLHFKCSDDDSRRLTAALDEALKRIINQGHTFGLESNVRNHLFDILKNHLLVKKVMNGDHPVTTLVISAKKYWHPTSQLVQEYTVSKRILHLSSISEWTDAYSDAYKSALQKINFELNEKQKEAVIGALQSGFYAITGGAGTGKTTILKAIVHAYAKMGYDIHCVALAGRASMRMQKSTGFDAFTIARFLLRKIGSKSKQILLIDEASMIDINTMYRLVIAMHTNVRILMVGDANQLPPIRSGLVFYDVLKSTDIPAVELDIVQRQDVNTGIPEYANKIINGIHPHELTYKNITFHDVAIEQVESVAIELYRNSSDVLNTQIIGMSKRGHKQRWGGIDQLNYGCQKACNTHGKNLGSNANGRYEYLNIRQGDPVIFTQNNYDENVFNGTLGRLISVEETEEHLGVVLTDSGDLLNITESLLDNIGLGYAMTLHKAQGSQFKRVIITLTNASMLNRNWLYTAITRAETHVDIVGPKEWFLSGIDTAGDIHKRRSFLADLLKAKKLRNVA